MFKHLFSDKVMLVGVILVIVNIIPFVIAQVYVRKNMV